jgi:hypothetical protein
MKMLFIILALLFATSAFAETPTAPKSEPDIKRVCHVMAEMTAKACYKTGGAAAAQSEDAETFVLATCNGAGDKAQEMCLSDEMRTKYGKMPTCAGLAAFTHDSIAAGGAKGVKILEPTKEEAEPLLNFVELLATSTATQLFNGCKRYEENERKKKEPFITYR